MTTNEGKYFFSYARNDSEFVLKLAKNLRISGANLWLDQLDIVAGQHWDRAVEKALNACESMILVLSSDSVASNNVMDELSYAIEKDKLVIPVLFQSCDIPFRLRRVQYVDFTEHYNKGLDQLLSAMDIRQVKSDDDIKPSLSVSARVFFILCTFSTDDIKKLLIEQNQKQNIFDIGIRTAGWKSWEGRSNVEIELRSMQKTL
jgi:TIR domain